MAEFSGGQRWLLAVFILFEIVFEVNKYKFINLVIFMAALIILGFILISTAISAVTEEYRIENCKKTAERREQRKADKAEKQLKKESEAVSEENNNEQNK